VFYNTTVNIQDWNNNASEIILCGADNSTIDNITMDHTDDENNGLLIVATQNSTITNSVFTDLRYGIYPMYSDSNTFTNITANSNTNGIYSSYSNSNTFTNMTLNSNGRGMDIQVSNSNTFTNITANSNTQYGIYFSTSALNTINNSKIESNTVAGIFLSSSAPGGPNNIYNNLFNNTNNIIFSGTIYPNNWNTTRQSGARIYTTGLLRHLPGFRAGRLL